MTVAIKAKSISVNKSLDDDSFYLDETTITELYRKYAKGLERFCFGMLGNAGDAADAVQEVFLRLISKGGVFEQEVDSKRWMFRVARNTCINRLQYENIRNNSWKTDVYAFQHASKPNVESAIVTKNLVEKTLQKCDSITAAAVSKHFVERMSQKSVGKSLGLSRVTVNKRLMDFRASFVMEYNAAS